jgi:hypothetical protein
MNNKAAFVASCSIRTASFERWNESLAEPILYVGLPSPWHLRITQKVSSVVSLNAKDKDFQIKPAVTWSPPSDPCKDQEVPVAERYTASRLPTAPESSPLPDESLHRLNLETINKLNVRV